MSNTEFTNTETGAMNLGAVFEPDASSHATEPKAAADAFAAVGFVTPANHGDVDAIEALIRARYAVSGVVDLPERLHDLVDDPTRHVLVARNFAYEGSLDGCEILTLRADITEPELGLFVVAAGGEQYEAGHALIVAGAEEVIARGFSSVKLCVGSDVLGLGLELGAPGVAARGVAAFASSLDDVGVLTGDRVALNLE